MAVKWIFRSLAATTGLLLILAATPAYADAPDGDAVTDAASSASLTNVVAGGDDVLAAPSSSSSHAIASTDENPAGLGDEAGILLGQLITQYFESYN